MGDSSLPAARCPEAFSAVGGVRQDGRAECEHCGRWIAAHPITGRLRSHKPGLRDMAGRGPWAFEEFRDDELVIYAAQKCECVTPQVSGTRNGYTCPAHRAASEIAKREARRG